MSAHQVLDWDRAERVARGETLEANERERREVAYYLAGHGMADDAIAAHVRARVDTITKWREEWKA